MSAAPAAALAELRCTLGDARIEESSGVAAASWSDDVVFTHNDSGDSARFFAVDARSCATRSVHTVRGAGSDDWEDMARGTASDGTPVLWLADIGDNGADRSSVVVYEVAEPGATSTSATVPLRSRWTLTYPDGARDAETLLVDPETGRPVVVSKDVTGGRSRVYRVPPGGSGVLEPLATLDVKALPGGSLAAQAWSVTGGAISPDRRRITLRTYLSAWVWTVAPSEPLAAALARPPESLDVPLTRQPEAVSFTRDGQGLWLTTEGAGAPVHLLALPPAGGAPLASTPSVVPSAIAPATLVAEERRSVAGAAVAVVAGLVVLGSVLVMIAIARRRH